MAQEPQFRTLRQPPAREARIAADLRGFGSRGCCQSGNAELGLLLRRGRAGPDFVSRRQGEIGILLIGTPQNCSHPAGVLASRRPVRCSVGVAWRGGRARTVLQVRENQDQPRPGSVGVGFGEPGGDLSEVTA
jgi:hypothetical protein